MQAMADERKRLMDRLNVLSGLKYSKGVEAETKDIQEQLKTLSTPINLRESGTAITPFGTVTAAAAPTEITKLQNEKAAAVAAGNTTAAAQIDAKIAAMTQLQDHRPETLKLYEVIDNPNASQGQKDAATARIAALVHIAPVAVSDFERSLNASALTPAGKEKLRQQWLTTHAEHAPAINVTMPVAIQDPKDPTKVIYVDRSQAIGQTPAAAVEKPLTAAQSQKLKTEKAADQAHVKASISTADELERLTNQLVGSEDKTIKPHPGLAAITGYRSLLPNLPESAAAQAQQKLDTFKGKILSLGREIASQNGKLGNMAVQEWKFVSDAVQAIDPKAGNLDQQLRDVVRQAKAFARNQQAKFESTYEDTAPAATGTGVDSSNPLLR